MDARNFRAPFLPPDQIWKRADGVREKYPAGRSFPVEVLDLAEFDLGLELVPADGLRRLCDTEAVLLGDLKTILVDKDAFTNPKQEYRLRFSVAHEIGHLILHPDVYGQVRPVSVEGWSEFFLNLPDEQYQWLELHANEFAGRLLVPPDRLKAAFDAAIQRAQASGPYAIGIGMLTRPKLCFLTWLQPFPSPSRCRRMSSNAASAKRSFGRPPELAARRFAMPRKSRDDSVADSITAREGRLGPRSTGRRADKRGCFITLFRGQPIEKCLALQWRSGRVHVTLSQDNEGTSKPAIIDDSTNRPALVGEVVISGDDEQRVVTKIAPGQFHGAVAGTITHKPRQLIEDRRGEGNPLDMEALLHRYDMEEELVSRRGHDEN